MSKIRFETVEEAELALALQNALLQYPRKTKDGLFESVGGVLEDGDGGFSVEFYSDDLRRALSSPLSYRVLVDEYDDETGELVRSDREFLMSVLSNLPENYESPKLPHVLAAEESNL